MSMRVLCVQFIAFVSFLTYKCTSFTNHPVRTTSAVQKPSICKYNVAIRNENKLQMSVIDGLRSWFNFAKPTHRLISDNDDMLKLYHSKVNKINAMEVSMSKLTNEQLQSKTAEFKNRLKQGESLNNILIEAFAVVKETCGRVLNYRQSDFQLISAMALHDGRIANLPTIEGHAYISVLTAYLHALTGLSVFVITNSDVIAREDGILLQNIYHFLKLQSGVIQSTQDKYTKQYQYLQDVIYISYEQLGYDFLQDNLAMSLSDIVQLKLYYFAIIQDVSFVLLQAANKPSRLERQANIPEFAKQQYHSIAYDIVTNHLVKNKHYEIIQTSYDYAHRLGLPGDTGHKAERKSLSSSLLPQIQLTRSGQKLIQEVLPDKLLGYPTLPVTAHWNYYLLHAIAAKECYQAGKDYEIIPLNSYNDQEPRQTLSIPNKQIRGMQCKDLTQQTSFPIGLQQALEIKEGITPISTTPHIVGRITFQKLLRLFPKLSGLLHVPVTTTAIRHDKMMETKPLATSGKKFFWSWNTLKKSLLSKFRKSMPSKEEDFHDTHKDILLQHIEEFFNIYQLKMMTIPSTVIETTTTSSRNSMHTSSMKTYPVTTEVFHTTQSDKLDAIANLVMTVHRQRRPIIINTVSTEDVYGIRNHLMQTQNLSINMITGKESPEELEFAIDRLLQGGSLDTITILSHRMTHHQPIRVGGSAQAMVKTFLKYMLYHALHLLTGQEKQRMEESIHYANTLLGVSQAAAQPPLPFPTMTAVAHFFSFVLPISIDYSMEKTVQDLLQAVIQTMGWKNVPLKQHRGISRLDVVTFLSQLLDQYISPATEDVITFKQHAKSLMTLFHRGMHGQKEEVIRKGGLVVIHTGHQQSQLEDLGLFHEYFGSEKIEFHAHSMDNNDDDTSTHAHAQDSHSITSDSHILPESIQTIVSLDDPFYYEINSHPLPELKEEQDHSLRTLLHSSLTHQRQAAYTQYLHTTRSLAYQFDEILSFQRSSLYSQRRAILTSSERGMLDIFYTYCTQTLDELYTQSFVLPTNNQGNGGAGESTTRFAAQRHPSMNYTLLYSYVQHYFPTMEVTLHDLQSQDTNSELYFLLKKKLELLMNKKQYEIQYGKYVYSYTTPIPTPVSITTTTVIGVPPSSTSTLRHSPDMSDASESSVTDSVVSNPTTVTPPPTSPPPQHHPRMITGPGSCIYCFVQYFRELTLYQMDEEWSAHLQQLSMLQEESLLLFGHPYYYYAKEHPLPLILPETISHLPASTVSPTTQSSLLSKAWRRNAAEYPIPPQKEYHNYAIEEASFFPWKFFFGRKAINPEREMIHYYREKAMDLFTKVMDDVRRNTVKSMFMYR